MRILAGDIGGTKTILAVVEVESSRVRVHTAKTYASAEHADFTDVARDFLQTAVSTGLGSGVDAACIGVAGPVVGGTARVTKLPWRLDEAQLQTAFELRHVRLVNDFVAQAYGILALGPQDLLCLRHGEADPAGPIGILGAGTGLGEAVLLRDQGRVVVLPSEGGHADFAPRSEIEVELWRWMATRYGHVSYDRVLSGPGIADLYRFLRDKGSVRESVAMRAAPADAADLAPLVTRFAEEHADPLAGAALDLFAGIYGAEAGNLALRAVATGGIYIGGGIARRIVQRLQASEFGRAFTDKGRLSSLVERIPVHVILNPSVGLLGAAVAGEMLLGPDSDPSR